MKLTYEQILSEIIDSFDSGDIGELCIDLALETNYPENLSVAIANLEELKKDKKLDKQDKDNINGVLNTLEYLITKV